MGMTVIQPGAYAADAQKQHASYSTKPVAIVHQWADSCGTPIGAESNRELVMAMTREQARLSLEALVAAYPDLGAHPALVAPPEPDDLQRAAALLEEAASYLKHRRGGR